MSWPVAARGTDPSRIPARKRKTAVTSWGTGSRRRGIHPAGGWRWSSKRQREQKQKTKNKTWNDIENETSHIRILVNPVKLHRSSAD